MSDNVYHPDPEINDEVAREAAESERADLKAGYPPRWWRCACGARHRRGFFPAGSDSHRCMRCGYVGLGGVLEEPEPYRAKKGESVNATGGVA